MALKEVDSNVRSRRSYIKKFSDEEDAEEEFNQIIEETRSLNEATDILATGDGNYGDGEE